MRLPGNVIALVLNAVFGAKLLEFIKAKGLLRRGELTTERLRGEPVGVTAQFLLLLFEPSLHIHKPVGESGGLLLKGVVPKTN